MKKIKKEELTFRNALAHERRTFGQVKAYTQTHSSKKDYNRREVKRQDKKAFACY